jgi:hypothetical protein
MDIKKSDYQIAFDARQKHLEESLKSEHRGTEPSRDPQLEIKPRGDSTQLGEGSHR